MLDNPLYQDLGELILIKYKSHIFCVSFWFVIIINRRSTPEDYLTEETPVSLANFISSLPTNSTATLEKATERFH